mmetsp:Transcript_3373/g.5248  ORF Transcript_3373/g.5248 Transcript_3373/m.5248 type:complete len:90 (-) Transcript_3373:376-645(-)
MASSTAATSIPVLPSFFPYASKDCKKVAQPFFDCFSKYSVKASDTDTETGKLALSKCLDELKKYQDCMNRYEKKHAPRRLRVQEEYRNK